MTICAVKDCDNEVRTRDLCAKHYARRWRHGSPHVTSVNRKKETSSLLHNAGKGQYDSTTPSEGTMTRSQTMALRGYTQLPDGTWVP